MSANDGVWLPSSIRRELKAGGDLGLPKTTPSPEQLAYRFCSSGPRRLHCHALSLAPIQPPYSCPSIGFKPTDPRTLLRT